MEWAQRTKTIRRNSLFVKLLGSFLLIIALLLSFNVLSFAFFQTNIHQEIIETNTLNLSSTVTGYEKQLQLVESDMLRFYFNERFSVLLSPDDQPSYTAVPAVKTEMNALLSNKMLHFDNVFILFRDNPFVIEKEGTSNTVNMFTKFYVSEPYGPVFWQRQFAEPFTFRLFPSARFREYKYDKSVLDKGELLPVIIKNKFNNQYIVAVLLDADGLYRSLHHNGEDSFFLLGPDGEPLYHAPPRQLSENGADDKLSDGLSFEGDSGYVKRDDRYYFYRKGESSGLLYVNVIPYVRIASQVEKLNLLLLSIMGAAVGISVLISIWLSMRFNNPIQGIIRLLQRSGYPHKLGSSIHEFDWLGRSISDMLRDNNVFDQDLRRKNKLLQRYGYMSKIKSFHHWNELRDLIDMSRPFYLVAFELTFTRQMAAEDQEKTVYYIHEYINLHMSGRFPDSVTLQVEKEQIVSLLFAADDAEIVTDMLHRLKEVFDRDREYGFVTIAFRSVRRTPEELAGAYEEVQAMLGSRQLNRDTQIVTELPEQEHGAFMTSSQEQELASALMAGSGERTAALIDGLLTQMESSQVSAGQFAELGKQLVAKVLKLLLEHHYDISRLLDGESPFLLLKMCWSAGDYSLFFHRFTNEAAELVASRKAEQDPIRDFVLGYVATHYGEDISLEHVADRLKMSRSYLSTYFHEKTGQTFSEYISGLRMDRAKSMLSTTNTRIQDIAAEIGYQNVNSFIRMFKKVTGQTPSDYRRSGAAIDAKEPG